MLIVDGQIHLWEKGTPSPQHRQESCSAEQAIAAMDRAGVDQAPIHPVLWDPDSNELAQEAVRNSQPRRYSCRAFSQVILTTISSGKWRLRSSIESVEPGQTPSACG
jgi:hypothetical protein